MGLMSCMIRVTLLMILARLWTCHFRICFSLGIALLTHVTREMRNDGRLASLWFCGCRLYLYGLHLERLGMLMTRRLFELDYQSIVRVTFQVLCGCVLSKCACTLTPVVYATCALMAASTHVGI